jgi:beta-lactamase class A
MRSIATNCCIRTHCGFLQGTSTPKKTAASPKLLPPDLVIADKPGELEAVRNDSGIVFVPNRPFVLYVVTTYLQDEREGQHAISAVALAAYQYFDRMGRSSEYGSGSADENTH